MPSSTPTNTPLKIVVDTNQFISVFVFRGQLTKLIFDLVFNGEMAMYVSPILIKEIREKLRFHGASKQTEIDVMTFIDEKGILVEPTIKISVCRDKEDNFALELSETADSNYLITRDKDLLTHKRWKNTDIIMPEDFLPLLRKMKLLD